MHSIIHHEADKPDGRDNFWLCHRQQKPVPTASQRRTNTKYRPRTCINGTPMATKYKIPTVNLYRRHPNGEQIQNTDLEPVPTHLNGEQTQNINREHVPSVSQWSKTINLPTANLYQRHPNGVKKFQSTRCEVVNRPHPNRETKYKCRSQAFADRTASQQRRQQQKPALSHDTFSIHVWQVPALFRPPPPSSSLFLDNLLCVCVFSSFSLLSLVCLGFCAIAPSAHRFF